MFSYFSLPTRVTRSSWARMARAFLLASAFVSGLLVVGCSDTDRSPPDDDGSYQKVQGLCQATPQFQDCSQTVLKDLGFSSEKIESLMTCQLPEAEPADSEARLNENAEALAALELLQSRCRP